jgi:hypothetical protein
MHAILRGWPPLVTRSVSGGAAGTSADKSDEPTGTQFHVHVPRSKRTTNETNDTNRRKSEATDLPTLRTFLATTPHLRLRNTNQH